MTTAIRVWASLPMDPVGQCGPSVQSDPGEKKRENTNYQWISKNLNRKYLKSGPENDGSTLQAVAKKNCFCIQPLMWHFCFILS